MAYVVQGHTYEHAASLAGYSRPSESAVNLRANPRVAGRLDEAIRQQLLETAPRALTVMRQIMLDESVAPKTRLDAAKTLMDRAGYVAPRGHVDGASAGQQSLGDMTPDQIHDQIQRLERELGNRAKTIDSTPATPAEDNQAVDISGIL